MQEIRMNPSEIVAFRNSCAKKVLHFLFKWNSVRQNGGVPFLISRRLQHRIAFKECTESGQLIAVWIGRILFRNVYIRPDADSD